MKKSLFCVLRATLLIILCSTMLHKARSQDSTAYVSKDIIKFSPLHLLVYPRSLQIAYEHRFPSRFSTQIDVGYVLPIGINNGPSDIRDVRGFKLKEEIRYYYYGKNYKTQKKNYHEYYLSAEIHQNIFDYVEFDDTQKYREFGYGFKLGFSDYLGRINLDLNAGVSFCYSQSDPIDIFGAITDWNNNKKYFIRPILSARVGYIL